MRPLTAAFTLLLALSWLPACGAVRQAQQGSGTTSKDSNDRIAVYVTPFYNAAGPVVQIGQYSAGLASHDEREVVTTVRKMKQRWKTLRFYELYVGAIRLYDLGYRNEAVYWFYTAQYRGRLFAMLADAKRLGGIGDRAFELYHAQDAFFELSGPVINGYGSATSTGSPACCDESNARTARSRISTISIRASPLFQNRSGRRRTPSWPQVCTG